MTSQQRPHVRVLPWMIAAANEIDLTLGLPRFDSAVSLASEIIAAHYAVSGQGASNCSAANDMKPIIRQADA